MSEEDRKRINKAANDWAITAPQMLGYIHGAEDEFILSQSRESLLKEEGNLLRDEIRRLKQTDASKEIDSLKEEVERLKEQLQDSNILYDAAKRGCEQREEEIDILKNQIGELSEQLELALHGGEIFKNDVEKLRKENSNIVEEGNFYCDEYYKQKTKIQEIEQKNKELRDAISKINLPVLSSFLKEKGYHYTGDFYAEIEKLLKQ